MQMKAGNAETLYVQIHVICEWNGVNCKPGPHILMKSIPLALPDGGRRRPLPRSTWTVGGLLSSVVQYGLLINFSIRKFPIAAMASLRYLQIVILL